jgi:hypothetical protein
MKAKTKMGVNIICNIDRSIEYKQKCLIESIWDIEHWRKGKLLGKETIHNICTDEGLNALLDIMFHASTQLTTWYVLIFETDTTPAAGTTYAVPVFTESSAYAPGTRPEFVEAAAAAKSLTNSANKAEFTMNATKTIYGAALVGAERMQVQREILPVAEQCIVQASSEQASR